MQDAPYLEIPLRARDGSIRAITRVSAEDYDQLATNRWRLTPHGYASRNMHRDGKWWSIPMHRAIMGLKTGDPREVDHINRDRLDNRRSNLRIVTKRQQMQNQPAQRGSTSQFRGVSFHAASGKWQAEVAGHYLGIHASEAEAGKVARQGRARLLPMSPD